jgi:hypothetical protein
MHDSLNRHLSDFTIACIYLSITFSLNNDMHMPWFHMEAIVSTTDLKTAFSNADIAILLGGFPRKKGMERYYKHHHQQRVKNNEI